MRTQAQLDQLEDARTARWRKAPSVPERFWLKVGPHDDPNACWMWRGGFDVGGYGTFWNGTRHIKAHVFMWELVNGPITPGLCRDHLCRNRGCVNPSHLEEVTNKTNVLRGVSIVAQRARAESCLSGHHYSKETTRITKKGARICRICERVRRDQYYARHPEMKVKIDEKRREWKRNKRVETA